MESARVMEKLNNSKIALVHDYLVQDGGAERVFGTLAEMFPKADIHVLINDEKHMPEVLKGRKVRTSFLNRWPGSKKFYQWYLPLMPLAAEHLDFSGYDLVISSSSSFGKGIIAPTMATHICYLHTPTRFLWENRLGYLAELPHPRLIRSILPPLLHSMRKWDSDAAMRPDLMITNSETSRQRIKKYYRREAEVINPPIDTEQIPLSRHEGDYWLAGGRLVAYKKFDLIVRAFNELNIPLIIFGTGPEEQRLKKLANGKITFTGNITDEEKVKLYRHARGFIHPQVEDFGITAIEAMAAGRPVIAYGEGGGGETVIEGVTGRFIEMQTWEDIGEAVIRHKSGDYDPKKIREQAEKFSTEVFKRKFLQTIVRTLHLHDDLREELSLIGHPYGEWD